VSRKRRSTRDRVRLFEAHKGRCHICHGIIQVGEKWEWSHPRPLALGGEDTLENSAPAHFACHRALTANEDIPRIARAKRQHARHIGAKAPPARKIKGPGFPKREKRGRIELPVELPPSEIHRRTMT